MSFYPYLSRYSIGGTNKINKNIVLQEIHKSDLQYETTKKNDLASYKYDLRNVEILLSEIREDKALLELLDKRLELIKMNVRYGKIDMSKIIQAEKQFVSDFIYDDEMMTAPMYYAW